jgi:hypothetical protein
MSEAIEVLARRRLALVEQRESIDAAIDAIDAQLIDAIEVGGAVVVGDQPVFRVQQRRTFDLNAAMQVVPPELIEAARVTIVDAKALKSMMPPALVEACSVAGRPFVSAVKA